MAIARMTIKGYGQVELNNAAFRRDGRIEAQSKPGDDFKDMVLENGMLVSVDKVNNKVLLPDTDYPIGLVYSSEHVYDERKVGLKDFYYGVDGGEFYPRIGYLSVQDIWTTNCISYDTTEFANDDALIAAFKAYKTTALYGGIDDETGAVLVSATAPTDGPVLKVIQVYTMPDGQFGVKFQVYSC